MPDAANALSGLQRHAAVDLISTTHQAVQRTKPGCGLQRHAVVDLISAAHQAIQRTKPGCGLQRHAVVGLISAAHQAAQRTKPGCDLQRHAVVGLISAAHQAIQRIKPGCGLQRHAVVGLISAAHQAAQCTVHCAQTYKLCCPSVDIKPMPFRHNRVRRGDIRQRRRVIWALHHHTFGGQLTRRLQQPIRI